MRVKRLIVLSAASLLILPLSVSAQTGRSPATTVAAAVPLSGRYLAARVAEQDHDYEGGAAQLDMVLAQHPNDQELNYAAFRLRLYAGQFDRAVQLAPTVLASKPGDGFANLVMAVQLIKKTDYRGAEAQLGRIGAENQLGPLKDYVLAWLRAGEKDYAAARQLLSKMKPNSDDRAQAPALVIDAEIDELAGDRAAAETKYRRAAQLDPSGLRVAVSVADGLRRLGKGSDAQALLKAFADKFGDSVVLDGLLASNAPPPKPPSPALGIADIMFDIGGILSADPRNQRADLALIFGQLAVELNPNLDFAWLMISGIYEQFGNLPQEVKALGKIGPTSPLYWQARLRIATLDAQDDRFDKAVAQLKALIAEKPDRIDAALTLADLMRGKERFADAVSAYDIAVSRLKKPDARFWPIYFGRGISLERVKQWPKAEADMKKALELSPDQPYVLNYLGYSWIDQGINLDEGMKMLKRATELRPDDGAVTDSVGWAYYRLGQFNDAVEWLERASEQKGDDATVVEHLGDAYWHVGRKREARFEWERALNQKPEKDRIPILQDKLANGMNAGNDKPTVYEKAATEPKKQGG
jgi:tetratricopeptide (TPR) repeat protein